MSYKSAAVEGGIIGAIVVFVFEWVFTHLAVCIAILAALFVVGYGMRPLWNDDTNLSEMHEMVDNRLHFDYYLAYNNKAPPYISYSIWNDTRFRLTKFTIDCGAGPVALPDVLPRDQAVDMLPLSTTVKPILPYQKCKADYHPVDTIKYRDQNTLNSDN